MSRTTTKSPKPKLTRSKRRSAPAQPTRTPPARLHRPAQRRQRQSVASRVPLAVAEATTVPVERRTKKAILLALLRREAGASMPEMMQATGWLAHSVRAALTGLRQDGGTLMRNKNADGTARYRLMEQA